MTRQKKINVIFSQWMVLLGITVFALPTSFASVGIPPHHWEPFLTLGGGLSVTSSLGRSATFIDPFLGGRDIYHANRGITTGGAADIFLGIEYDMPPTVGVQVGLGYNQTSALNVNGTGIQGSGSPTVISFNYKYRVVLRQFLAEGKVLFNIAGTYHPYVVFGAGVSKNSSSSFRTFTNSAVAEIIPIEQPQFTNRTSSSFTYLGGLGLEYDVLCGVRLGFGYRFTNFGKLAFGQPNLQFGASNALSQSDVYVNEFLVHITFL